MCKKWGRKRNERETMRHIVNDNTLCVLNIDTFAYIHISHCRLTFYAIKLLRVYRYMTFMTNNKILWNEFWGSGWIDKEIYWHGKHECAERLLIKICSLSLAVLVRTSSELYSGCS
jgi:hypothetical protein